MKRSCSYFCRQKSCCANIVWCSINYLTNHCLIGKPPKNSVFSMASTQVVSLNTVDQMKRVAHFPDKGDSCQSVGAVVPHFVSPRKMSKPPQNQRKRSSSFSTESKHHFKKKRKDEFVRPTKFLLVTIWIKFLALKLFNIMLCFICVGRKQSRSIESGKFGWWKS